MKKIFVLFLVLTAAFFSVSVFTSCRSAPLPELPKELPPFEPNEFELRVFELTNRERALHRLPSLIWHEAASFVAREHCEDMHRNNFMRHTGSDGSNIRQRLELGVPYPALAEKPTVVW